MVSSSVWDVIFEMPVRYSGKDMQNVVGESSVDFRGETQADANLSHI